MFKIKVSLEKNLRAISSIFKGQLYLVDGVWTQVRNLNSGERGLLYIVGAMNSLKRQFSFFR